jgi:hyperosmotically inducible protein
MKLYQTLVLTSLAASSALACHSSAVAGSSSTNSATLAVLPGTQLSGSDTPTSRGRAPTDLETTQDIRRALLTDPALSSEAKNVSIVTKGGFITLRGPVSTQAERGEVSAKAIALSGADRVDDDLDIDAKR